MAGLVPGDPNDAGTVCGPVISERQRDRIQGYLDSAIAEGGRFACGTCTDNGVLIHCSTSIR